MATPLEQLELMRNLGENWDGYGADSPQANAIDLAQSFVSLIEALRKAAEPNGGALYVSPTRIGGVLIEWEDHLREHEIQIDPDGSLSFLHLDKGTGKIETRKFSPESPVVVQPGVLRELTHSVAA
jgi:hypothetical protein